MQRWSRRRAPLPRQRGGAGDGSTAASCGRPIPEEVIRCSARTCPEFAPTWARDTRRRLFVNLRAAEALGDVLGDGSGRRPVPVRSAALLALARREVLGRIGAAGSIPRGGGVQSAARASGGASYTGRRRCGRIGRPGIRASSRRGYGRSRSAGSPTCTASSRSSRLRESVGGGIRDGAS